MIRMQQLTLSTYVADEAKDLKSKKYQTRSKEERRKKKEDIRDMGSSTTIELNIPKIGIKKTPISYRRRKNICSLYNANKLKEVKTTWSTASIA